MERYKGTVQEMDTYTLTLLHFTNISSYKRYKRLYILNEVSIDILTSAMVQA